MTILVIRRIIVRKVKCLELDYLHLAYYLCQDRCAGFVLIIIILIRVEVFSIIIIFEMSTIIPRTGSIKSPYQHLPSPNLHSNRHTRQVYLQQNPGSTSRKMKSLQPDTTYRYQGSSRNPSRDFKIDLNSRRNYSQDKVNLSDRKSCDRKWEHTSRGSKFNKHCKKAGSTSRLDKHTDKSTAISSLLAGQAQRHAKLKEDRKKHEQGKNCRVVVIEGQEETEIFVEVEKMGDITGALKKELPRVNYYRAVPVQLTLDYLLMQPSISANFLNGQILYLKPAVRHNSLA